jgi:transcription elongation GreA/GreB family factor
MTGGAHIESMSRAFVNEDAPSFDELPDRVISEHPNDVTAEGLAQIEAQLAEARRAYAAAQESDDRAAMASASRDVRYWNARRGTAHVVPPSDDNTQVRFGSAVTIVRSDGRQQTFRIVGEDEADPARGTISHASPLARSLFGKGVGDVARAGADDAEITEIH